MDGHDGHRLVKGHAGAAILPAVLALLDQKDGADTRDLLAAMAVGYEVALRAGFRLHRTTSEYHSSGAWNALGAAAVGSRLLGLDTTATHHALGIAEYSAPRAPMMRAIAHPTMVKDSSAWGAQTGVAAALLAADGFTGAPAELLATQEDWADLGTTWRCLEQYFKPYPVCRWAHPAVTAVLDLVSRHHFTSADIADVEVTTFQAAVELSTQSPDNTEQAQYSLPFAIATALAHGTLTPDTLLEPKTDPTTCRLLDIIRMKASPEMSAEFPGGRRAAADLRLRDGRVFSSGPVAAKGDPEDPMTDAELSTKFRLYTSHLGHSDSLAELLARDTVIPAEQLLSAMARPGDGQS